METHKQFLWVWEMEETVNPWAAPLPGTKHCMLVTGKGMNLSLKYLSAFRRSLPVRGHFMLKTNLCRPKNSGHGRSLLARVSADRFWYTFFCISEYSMQEHRDYFYCITSPWPQLDVMKDSWVISLPSTVLLSVSVCSTYFQFYWLLLR